MAPCRISSIFGTYVGEERDGVPFGVSASKDDAANLRRAVKARGGELKNGERRTAGPRGGHEGCPDPIQVRFDRSQTLETWNSAVRLSRGESPRLHADATIGAAEHWSSPANTGMRNGRGQINARLYPERLPCSRRMALTFETACGAYQPPSLCWERQMQAGDKLVFRYTCSRNALPRFGPQVIAEANPPAVN